MAATDVDIARVNALLDGARLWGMELDTRYRVLALTVEVEPARHPDGAGDDLRLQLVVHPVSTVTASLVRVDDDGRATIERFDEGQLPLVVDRMDGPHLTRPVLDGPPPDPQRWAPELSLEGASTALDGRAHHLEVAVGGEDGRRLRLAAWFDDLDVRRPDASEVDVGALPSAEPS